MSLENSKKFPLLFTLALFFVLTHSNGQGLFQQAEDAYSGGRYGEYIRFGEQLAAISRNPSILYRLSKSYAAEGNFDKSMVLLQELGKKGLPYDIGHEPLLQSLFRHAAGKKLIKIFRKNQTKIDNSEIELILSDTTLIPEGIAMDPKSGDFFISSLAKSKVVKHTTTGNESDFVASGEYGIWRTLGMKVAEDILIVCSASEHPQSNGHAGVFWFNLKTGDLIKKFTIEKNDEAHLFNDLTISKNGIVYFTDSKAGAVWEMRPDKSEGKLITSSFIYPNGITLDTDEQYLYVADFTGVSRISLEDYSIRKVDNGGSTYLEGIDGLYMHDRKLIAIQDSNNNDDRIASFTLDDTGLRVKTVKVLQSHRTDFKIPTTGVIQNGFIYYIANSHLRNLNPDGSIKDLKTIRPPKILRLRV